MGVSAPLRILQIHPPVGHGVDVYRVDNLREQIERAGHESDVVTLAELVEIEDGHGEGASGAGPAALASLVADRDLVILHRVAWDTRIEALVEAARRQGATIVFEADDLVFVPGAESWVDGVRRLPDHEVSLYHEGVERYAASYRRCDAFLASTPFLAGLRPFGPKPSQVIRNVLGQAQLDAARRIRRAHKTRGNDARNEQVIGFGAGTATHDRDMREVIPALRELLSRRTNLRLEIVGPVDLGAELDEFADRVTQREARPWEQWWEILAGFDVALAPLERDNPYCRAKSALKFLEAAILGVPVVASRIDDYVQEIDDGRTGLLAGDAAEWCRAIESLLDDDARHSEMARAAREHVESHCTASALAEDSCARLAAIRSGSSHRPAAQDRLLDIVWLIPSPFPGSGGHANIFAAARGLERRGHRNTFLVDTSQLQAHDGDAIRGFVDRNFGETGVRFEPGWDLGLQHADLAVATSWATAETVARSDASATAYFVQDFENLFFPPGEDAVRAERTYHLGLSCVTLGGWLTDELRSRYGADSSAFSFPVTVDGPASQAGDESEPENARKGDPPRLLFFAQPGKPRRGYRLGLEGLALFHAACPEVKIAFFGSKDVEPGSVPVPFEDHGILSEQQLADLYRRADAALVISMTNPTLVSPNMMRCGCVVVELDLPNNGFEYSPGEDSLLAEPTPEGIASALRSLFQESDLLDRLRDGGTARVARRSMENTVDEIESAFVRRWLTGETATRPLRLEAFQGERASWVSLEDGPVAQTLRGRGDGLARIDLQLGTFERTPGDLRVQLADRRSGAVVADLCVRGSAIRNNEWNEIPLEPIADAGEREFELRLSMVEADAPPVAVYLSGTGSQVEGPARRGDASLAAPICFAIWSHPAGAPAPPSGHASGAPAVTAFAGRAESARPDLVSPVMPVAADSLSPEATRVIDLIRSRGERERHRQERLEDRTAALERASAGLTGWLDRMEGRLTRPPFDRLLRGIGLATSRQTHLEATRFVTAEVRGETVVAQRFVAEEPGLDRILVRLGTEGRRLVAPVVVRLRAGGPGGPVLREVTVDPERIYDNQFCIAAFEPLSDSEGSAFCFEVASPGAVRGCAPRVWGHRSRGGRQQRRYHRGARAAGRLDFRLAFSLDPSIAPGDES